MCVSPTAPARGASFTRSAAQAVASLRLCEPRDAGARRAAPASRAAAGCARRATGGSGGGRRAAGAAASAARAKTALAAACARACARAPPTDMRLGADASTPPLEAPARKAEAMR